MSVIESGNVANYVIEGIGHVMFVPVILHFMLLGEPVLWIPVLGELLASGMYHLCLMGVLFNPLLLNTLRRADYVAISSMEVAWLLRLLNVTWRPRRKGEELLDYYRDMYLNASFAIGIVLCFQVVNNSTTWIIYNTWAGTFVTFGTILLLIYVLYVYNHQHYVVRGYWVFAIDAVIMVFAVALLFYAGNPGDEHYMFPHGAWHIVAVIGIELLGCYIRIRDYPSIAEALVPPAILYFFTTDEERRQSEAKKKT